MKSTTWSRSLQMTLCAAAVCSAGLVNAQMSPPTGTSQSASEAKMPAQASPSQARSQDGKKKSSASHGHSSGTSQSASETKMPAQASPSQARSQEGRMNAPPSASSATGTSQSASEVKMPAQSSPSTGAK